MQIGTAFLNCEETGIPTIHQEALAKSDGSNTRTTRAFSGRPARGLINRYMNEMLEHENSLPGFPIMNALTGKLRARSASDNSPDFVSLWSGQAAGLNQKTTVSDLIEQLIADGGLKQ